jgi:hypothetical protein
VSLYSLSAKANFEAPLTSQWLVLHNFSKITQLSQSYGLWATNITAVICAKTTVSLFCH